MVGREEIILAERIKSSLDKALVLESNRVHAHPMSYDEAVDPAADYISAEDVLYNKLEEIYRECQMLAERLLMPKLATEIRQKFETHSKSGGCGVTFNSTIADYYTPALTDAWSIYESLASISTAGAMTGKCVLESILRSSAQIVQDKGLSPNREAQVRDAVFAIIKYAFRDATKEDYISKSIKTYRPDIGIRSIMTAVEFKFIRTGKDMKSHLDQVVTDMGGYGNHPDWRNFYAVFYQSGPFYTDEDIKIAFREANAGNNWTPIVVNGPADLK